MSDEQRLRPEQDAWRRALQTRMHASDAGVGIPAAQARLVRPRRSLLRGAFLGGVGLAVLGSAGGLVDYLWPRNLRGFGGPVAAGNLDDLPPAGGPPREFAEGQFWLVNLDPSDTGANGSGGAGGLLALWKRCPHLGCSVPWTERGRPPAGTEARAWFQCPCHGSTYTRAGVRVFGPAPRSMDTMALHISSAGDVTVETGMRRTGGLDNPRRAVPAEPGASSS